MARRARHGLPRSFIDAASGGRDRVAAGALHSAEPTGETPAAGGHADGQDVDPGAIESAPADRVPAGTAHGRRSALNSLLEQHHYLGYQQPVGEHVNVSGLGGAGPPHRMSGMEFGAASPEQPRSVYRLERGSAAAEHPLSGLQHPLSDSALGRSTALGLAPSGAHGETSMSQDWERLYQHPIYFVETFVDPTRFRGTCYRAANWIRLGQTTGRGKDDHTNRPNRSIKEVLGYPLTPRFRELLQEVV